MLWRSQGKNVAAPSSGTPLEDVRFVVLDTELTSLDAGTNRLLSVGALAMQGSRIRVGETFYRVVNPRVELPPEAVVIHRLVPEEVAQAQEPEPVVRELADFLRGALAVGHFVEIDVKVLKKEFALARLKFDWPMIDTARVFRWLDLRRKAREQGWEHGSEDLSLAALAARYQIDVAQAHHALDDAWVTARLWQRLLFELSSEGVRTVKQALRIGRP